MLQLLSFHPSILLSFQSKQESRNSELFTCTQRRASILLEEYQNSHSVITGFTPNLSMSSRRSRQASMCVSSFYFFIFLSHTFPDMEVHFFGSGQAMKMSLT